MDRFFLFGVFFSLHFIFLLSVCPVNAQAGLGSGSLQRFGVQLLDVQGREEDGDTWRGIGVLLL